VAKRLSVVVEPMHLSSSLSSAISAAAGRDDGVNVLYMIVDSKACVSNFLRRRQGEKRRMTKKEEERRKREEGEEKDTEQI
jgi:membrane protein involved in colicin uptake